MASAAAKLVGPGIQIIKSIADGANANARDKEFRNGWTQTEADQVSKQNPGKNVMIVYNNHTANFQGSQQSQLECQCPNSGQTLSYTCYVFDSGDFEHKGDGGYLNWCFTGNFKRNGNKVTFSKP